jgi:hypothetical protein
MFGWFKKKEKAHTGQAPQLADLDGQPLQSGDQVMALRYEMGSCRLEKGPEGWRYQSLTTGQTISWLKMIDAVTGYQKVKKLTSGED